MKLCSICIPSRGRNEILIQTLNSIFQSPVDPSLYEVVVYDSSDGEGIQPLVNDKFKNYNLHYKKGDNFGYLNLIEALKLGTGAYLKLHNDYSVFVEGALEKMVNEIRSTLDNKPLLLFSNGALNENLSFEYSSFNEFLYNISYYSTWSTLFGIWKEDFDKLTGIEINSMFPHTSFLFSLSYKKLYKINNDSLFENIIVGNKGGYNLFSVFGKDYLNMVEDCYIKHRITLKTFNHIKKDMQYDFFAYWYIETHLLKNSYTFCLKDIKSSLRVHYSEIEYYKIIGCAYFRFFRSIFMKFFKK